MIQKAFDNRAVKMLACVAAFVWLLLIAFAHPISHDESQYVAATDLVSGGLLPYRDFAYLQTPLQPLLFAPLDWLIHERLFLVSRAMNAVLGAVSVLLIYSSSRRLGATHRAAFLASAMLLACHSFLWSAGVARNDMLPAALLAAGLWMWLRADRPWKYVAVGLALGFAASAKISYAVTAAAILAAGILLTEPEERRNFKWVAMGEAAGLLPVLVFIVIAPGPFFFEAITFPAKAPPLFYDEIGKHWRLGEVRYLHVLLVAAIGPALIAAIEIARRSIKRPKVWIADSRRRVLFAAVGGGLLSATLNRPFNPPYLVPALIPLFILVALALSEREPVGQKMRWALALSGTAGMLPALTWIALAVTVRDWPAVLVEQRNEEIGAALRAIHVHGPVAGLRGDFLIDSDYSLDPDFAAGPFLFRTVKFVTSTEAASWHIVTRDQTVELAIRPPGAIVTELEPAQHIKLDARLESEAATSCYVPVRRAKGFEIWIRGSRCRSFRPESGGGGNVSSAAILSANDT